MIERRSVNVTMFAVKWFFLKHRSAIVEWGKSTGHVPPLMSVICPKGSFDAQTYQFTAPGYRLDVLSLIRFRLVSKILVLVPHSSIVCGGPALLPAFCKAGKAN